MSQAFPAHLTRSSGVPPLSPPHRASCGARVPFGVTFFCLNILRVFKPQTFLSLPQGQRHIQVPHPHLFPTPPGLNPAAPGLKPELKPELLVLQHFGHLQRAAGALILSGIAAGASDPVRNCAGAAQTPPDFPTPALGGLNADPIAIKPIQLPNEAFSALGGL